MTELIRYETARRALAEAVAFDEVMSIMNVSKQAELYARQANDTELIEKATEIRVRAQRKAGEMLKISAERGERVTGDGSVNQHNRQSRADTPTLAEIGVSKTDSSRWQSLASMSEEHFETAVATAKDTAGQVTTAFMLREAKKAKPQAKPLKTKKAEAQREELRQAQERGVSIFCTYARLTIGAINAMDSLTGEERQVFEDLQTAVARMATF